MQPQSSKRPFGKMGMLIAIVVFFGSLAIIIPNILTMSGRSKQSRTLGDILAIATALGSYQVDHDFYPFPDERDMLFLEKVGPLLAQEGYYNGRVVDAWGQPLLYRTNGVSYAIISYGKDNTPGNRTKHPHDHDIVNVNGTFVKPAWSSSREKTDRALLEMIDASLKQYRQETGTFPLAITEQEFTGKLLPSQYGLAMYDNAWSLPFRYISDGQTYTLISPGKDSGVVQQEDQARSFDNVDFIFSDGRFVAPDEIKLSPTSR